jgi:hypothetical protein
MKESRKFESFDEFYTYYLGEHRSKVNLSLHVFGTGLCLLMILGILFQKKYLWVPLLPFVGYGPAWIGHYFFEKNRPATFLYPKLSLKADLVLFYHVITGKIKLF